MNEHIHVSQRMISVHERSYHTPTEQDVHFEPKKLVMFCSQINMDNKFG